jgi:hypothetical protein
MRVTGGYRACTPHRLQPPPLAHAVGRVALMAQLDAGAAVRFVVEGAARGGAVDHMDDQRARACPVHG